MSLRYFNVAGSDPQGRIGQATRQGDTADQGRLRGRRRQAVARARSTAPTTTLPTAPVCATISTSRIWRARTWMRSIICAAAAPRRCSIAATATATACARCSTSVQRVAGQGLSSIKEEPRRAGDPPTLVARADRVRTAARLDSRRLDELDAIVEQLAALGAKLSSIPGETCVEPLVDHSATSHVQWLEWSDALAAP